MLPKGNILDIHRFSLHDGPGIRTTIFFKGCPLRCTWCHNYESQNSNRQLYFNPEKCTYCGNCADVCVSGVHSIVDQKHLVNFNKCNLSCACVEVCSEDALKILGREMDIDEILDEIKKDRAYYQKSGGGVTISGGEPMMQFPFLLQLVKALKQGSFHICLDTSGYASQSHFEKLLPYIDLYHFDVKILDQESHKFHTGVKNDIILRNLDFIARKEKAIILRCPIIPGINDNNEHFNKLARLASQYSSILKIELLPYHRMGVNKYNHLDQQDLRKAYRVPHKDEVQSWKKQVIKVSDKAVEMRAY